MVTVVTSKFTGHKVSQVSYTEDYLILVFYEGMTREGYRKYQEG
jgi:hypothetical protein